MRISIDCFSQLRIWRFFSFLAGILLLSMTAANAQDIGESGLPSITNYTPQTFKANPQNWDIVEDNQGIMFFGNQGLILEYDGVTWQKVNFQKNKPLLCRALSKDKHGHVFYGASGDFGYLQPDSLGQITGYTLLKFIPESKRNFFDVWSVRCGEDGIYFQSRERIFRISEDSTGGPNKKRVTTWEPKTRFMYAFLLNNVYYVHQQGLGLFKLVDDSLQFIPGSEFMGKERLQLMLPYDHPEAKEGFRGGKNQYLLGMFYAGLYVWDGQTGFHHLNTEADELIKAGSLYKGTLLDNGSYALATTGKGVAIINSEGKLLNAINRDVGLQDESIYGLYVDSHGTLWLGLDNGISRVDVSSPITQFAVQSGIKTSTLTIKRFEGRLYVGSTNGFLGFNEKTRKFEQIPIIPPNQVFTTLQDRDELLTGNDGLFYIKNSKVKMVRSSLSGDLQIAALFIPKNNQHVLFTGSTFGLGVFVRSDTVIGNQKGYGDWQYLGNMPGLDEQIWTFAEESDSVFWAGTQNSYAFRIHLLYDNKGKPLYNTFSFIKMGQERGLGSGGGPFVANVGAKTYFMTDSAIYTYNKQTDHFIMDTTFGTFPNGGGKDQVFISEDVKKRVWVVLGKTLRIAEPLSTGGYKVDSTAFLPLSWRTISYVYPEANGIDWICTADGLFRYDEHRIKNYDLTFKTLLRFISAGKSRLNTLEGQNAEISINHSDNTLRFEYAAPFYEYEDRTQYQTWLEGFDAGWSDWGSNSYKEYTNLSAGKYRFHVRAINIYQKISEETVYAFEIEAPWYSTWWAILLYILAGLAAVVSFVRYRTVNLHEKQKELETKVQERTQEVQQQAEELSTVNQVSQALVAQLNLDDLIKLVGDQLKQLFRADIVYLALLDQKTKMISFPYQHGDNMPPMKLGEGLTSKIIITGIPLLINKEVHERANQLGVERVGLPAASYLGVPIPVGDEVIGVLSVQTTHKENRFGEKDQRLLTTIAANVGMALRKAKLFEEVKQARMEAEAASNTAEQANKAKSAFLSTVSHELRTPLTSVLGFAKIIKKRLEERIFPLTDKSDPRTTKTIDQISENLNVVVAEGQRLTTLINDVLDLAKIEAGKMEWSMEPVNITEIVERAIAATSSLFDQKSLALKTDIDSDLPLIMGDRDKLIQVVVNLLSNAVKFTPQGTVTCKVRHEKGEIIVGITDTGNGIAPGDHAAVFEQFKQVGDTLTDKPKGTGLGLPICKEIVEHHGGQIWLESELGKGSTFLFALPIHQADDVAARPLHLEDLLQQLKKRMEQSHPAIKGKQATILVVDDDDGIRSLLRQVLGDAGYNVEEASNGKMAIASIRTVRPDLILLDVMMPEMNGFDVAAIVKNDPQTMDIPIIILSIVQDKARGFRIGVDRYLTKPIDTNQLFSEIGSLLEQGKSRKKVMVVDEDNVTIRTLADVLHAKGYQVVESDGKELVAKAVATQPDIIILNSILSGSGKIVQTLRFEKGLENVLFLIYQ